MTGRENAKEQVASWVEAHRALLAVARERSELEGREGSALLRALRSRVHVHLGYGSFIEYAGRLFGYAARTVHDKLRTAEALEKLPQLARALLQGEVTWSAARELARVATVETEGEWLEVAKGRTVREIEQRVAGHEPGSRPSDPVGSASQRHVLRFEVAAETLATFRQALKALRQRSGGHLDDDAALLLMARHVLSDADHCRTDGSRSDGGRNITDAGRTDGSRSDGGRNITDAGRSDGSRFDGGRNITDAGRSDASRFDGGRNITDAGRSDASRSDASRSDASRSDGGRNITDAGRSDASRTDGSRSDGGRNITDAGCSDGSRSDGGVDAASPRASDAGRASYQLALTLCERCQRGFQEADGERLEVDAAIVEMARCDATHIAHVGRPSSEKARSVHAHAQGSPPSETGSAATHAGAAQSDSRSPSPAARATQTIPPALRRHIHARDAGRCVVPGCRHTTFVDLHHVKPRAEGGLHDADNLAVLCGAHHRAVHRGALSITGSVSAGLRFRHADGTPYGDAPASQLMATLEKVFRALRGLGFKERDARQALHALTAAGTLERASPSAEELLRAALQKLAPPVTPQHRTSRAV